MLNSNSDHTVRAEIKELTAEIAPKLIEIRRIIHANPELGFEEHETSALVQDTLASFGVACKTGFAKTGVAAMIGDGSAKTIALRGDMDALPIEETGTSAYASQNPGKMHACGHDAHTAIALGFAYVMSSLQDKLSGRAMVIFQPAEEGLGGARAMVDDGVLDWGKPDAILGYHNWPLLSAGTVGWHPTIVFASTDSFDIEIRGRSGHAAHPHLTIDPIVAAGALVSALQSVVSRETAPLDAAVLSLGCIQGGTTRNQIPDMVHLQGTTRSLDPNVRNQVIDAIKRVCRGISETHRVSCDIRFFDEITAVINDRDTLESVLEEARLMLGADNLIELPQGSMGSEDFAEFSTRLPSAHLRIGSKLGGHDTMLHRSNFDLDEACIPTAVQVLAAAAVRLM